MVLLQLQCCTVLSRAVTERSLTLRAFHWRSKRYCMAMNRRMSSAYSERMVSMALASWNLHVRWAQNAGVLLRAHMQPRQTSHWQTPHQGPCL